MARKKRRQERDIQAENRKQILRERKERRERRLLLSVLGPVVAVAVGIFAYGGLRDLYLVPRRPVARVEGETITAARFAHRLQWYRRQMLNNLQSFLQLASTSDPSFLLNLAEQQRQGAAEATVEQLIEEILVRKEAQARGIQVTEADIDQRIRDDLATLIAPPEAPSEEEAITATGTVTGTAPAPTKAVTMTATAISTERIGEEFRLTLQPVLDQVGLSVAEYRDIVRNAIYRQRLGEAMVPEVQPQVEAAYMRFTSRETAERAASALKAGASWEAAVAQFQQPTPESSPAPEAAPAGEGAAEEGQGTATTATPEGGSPRPAETFTPTPPPTEPPTATPSATTARTATPRPTRAVTLTPTPASPTAAGSPAAEGARARRSGEGQPPTPQQTGLAARSAGRQTVSAGTSATRAPTKVASPTPAYSPTPTATPEPYASYIGERAWVTRFDVIQQWSLNDKDADAVMALEKGATGGPYEASGNMWYVVYVFDRAAERSVPKERLQTLRDQAVSDWVNKRKEEVKPDRYPLGDVTPEEPPWFVSAWERLFPKAAPTVDLGTLSIPTVAINVTGEPATAESPGGTPTSAP